MLSTAQESEDQEGHLTGLHLKFRESMDGDMTNRTLSFERGIRVGTRKVQSWQETFDAANMNEISSGESTLDCDRLSISIAPGYDRSRHIKGMPTPWEMSAQKGVVFRTRGEKGLWEGTASRAVYSSQKDLFTIRGEPNRGATIRMTHLNGQPGPGGVFHEVTMRPKPFELLHGSVERLNLGQVPASERAR